MSRWSARYRPSITEANQTGIQTGIVEKEKSKASTETGCAAMASRGVTCRLLLKVWPKICMVETPKLK
jgi:hypothetical protein